MPAGVFGSGQPAVVLAGVHITLEASDLTSLIRKISQTIGALAILGMFSTTIASADQALSVAAATPATAASSTSTVAPDANTALTSSASEVAQAGPLSDVPLNSWAYDAVNQLAKDGIIKGYPDGKYKGNRPMTRYEAAVLAYRAVDMIESQITAGKAVEKADINAANKLLKAFGAELKAVEEHVEALQKQANATDKSLGATDKLAKATAAIVRHGQFHVQALFRADAYGQNISANVGALPVMVNGVTYAPASALPGGVGVPPTGTLMTGPSTLAGAVIPGGGVKGGLVWGPQPGSVPQNNNTIGQYGHGLGMQYLGLIFAGQPDANSEYFVKLTNLERYSNTNFYPAQAPAACTSVSVGVAGAPCNPGNTSPLNASGVFTSNFINFQQLWYQYNTPGGLYARVGKFQQVEASKQALPTSWGMTDFVNGAQVGYRSDRLNAAVGYGFQDTAAENNLINGIPASSVVTWAQADYQFGKHIDLGGYLTNYRGNRSVIWDSSAVNCLSTAVGVPKSSVVIPLVAGQAFTTGGCGAGFAPITYGVGGPSAGLPLTGAYINASTNQTTLGGTIVGNFGKLRIALDGTDRIGTDPTTGANWLGNLTGFAQADYGPTFGHPGVRGQYTMTVGGFAAGMNGIGPGFSYTAAPSPWSQFSGDWADEYFVYGGIKKWITNSATFGVYYANMGLLPSTLIPAGSAACPGCVISGDTRNAVWGEASFFL